MNPNATTSARVLPFGTSPLREISPAAQAAWAAASVRRRLGVVRELRHLIAEHTGQLAATIRLPQRTSPAETLAAEILPLADACRFLEREAEALLAPQKLGRRGRPFWLGGSKVELRREPFGVILVIAASNYPLLLPGVQLVQALVAGNAVLVKPGHGGAETATLLASLLRRAGLPDGLLSVLGESTAEATAAIDAGVDKVVLTGSHDTGREVLGRLARSVTPAVLELSGCDPVFVRADADLELVIDALCFGTTFNGSFTCIAPRRIFVARSLAAELEVALAARLRSLPPIPVGRQAAAEVRRLALEAFQNGARLCGELPLGELPGRHPPAGHSMRPLLLAGVTPDMAIAGADLAAPVLSLIAVDGDNHALEAARLCRYQLGATIFGGEQGARVLADQVAAGVVVINDLIVPTADPRVPFGGRAASGFGVTRGAEGLLELTRTKAVIHRRGRFRPHFDEPGPEQERLLFNFVRIAHARTLKQKLRAVFSAIKLMIESQRRMSDVNDNP